MERMSKKFYFGKIDFYGRGRKINAVYVNVNLTYKNGMPVFTASAEIWNSTQTDCICCGQCLDAIHVANPLFARIRRLWELHHLNDSHAGTEQQESFLSEYKKANNIDRLTYSESVKLLQDAGLYVDNGYRYGSGWVYREIPDNDLAEIKELLTAC